MVLFAVVRSHSVGSNATVSGLSRDRLFFCYISVDKPGDRRTGFAVVRSYIVRVQLVQRLVQSWAVYILGSGLIVGGLPRNRQLCFVISG